MIKNKNDEGKIKTAGKHENVVNQKVSNIERKCMNQICKGQRVSKNHKVCLKTDCKRESFGIDKDGT